jgi:hypothetical protein
MGVLIAAALPVLPGQSDRVRTFAMDLEPHREEWERLNREATVTRYITFLQESPQSDVAEDFPAAASPVQVWEAKA